MGENVNDIKEKLEHFTIEYSGTGETVASQSPIAGERLEEGDTIRLMLK